MQPFTTQDIATLLVNLQIPAVKAFVKRMHLTTREDVRMELRNYFKRRPCLSSQLNNSNYSSEVFIDKVI